jgi:hypothetical protein
MWSLLLEGFILKKRLNLTADLSLEEQWMVSACMAVQRVGRMVYINIAYKLYRRIS